LELLDKLLEAHKEGKCDAQMIEHVEAALLEKDLKFLEGEIPIALDHSLEGVDRVAQIVRAMKEFSHPGTEEKVLVNIKRALENTLMVSSNEWKYVAEVESSFDPDLPDIYAHPGGLNQVFLNLIVNAAQAIGEKRADQEAAKGSIFIETTRDGEEGIKILVRDSGCGIPLEIQEKVFDPFFTTKDIGKGTGQGLAIARSVVVDKHVGTIICESVAGEGTTFIVRLPIATPEATEQ
jgi:signal transduction histidine kinase